MKKIIFILLCVVSNQIYSQNEIISVSPSSGSTGTNVEIIGKTVWGKRCNVYIGSSSASTVTVSGKTITAIVGNPETGSITVFDAINEKTYTMNNFTFTCYPKILISDGLIEYKNSHKTTLVLLGNGLSSLKSAKIDNVVINLGSGLTILSDSKAYINLPDGVKSGVVSLANPIENVTFKYE